MTKEEYKVRNEVFDRRTLKVLEKFRNKYFIELGNCISTGKEANVFSARTKSGYVAVKIFRTYTSNFDKMEKYIIGDSRFGKVKKKKHDLIFQWCKKEFRNLNKCYETGLSVPTPYVFKENVIIMEFIGNNNIASPLLKDVNFDKNTAEKMYKTVINFMKNLFNKANMVHADLSEFNILYYKKKLVFIDMAQSVLTTHPMAINFLKKDLINVNSFFKKKEVKKLLKWNEFKKLITIN